VDDQLSMQPSLILAGNSGVTHVGSHLAAGAGALGWQVSMCNTEDAFGGNRLIAKFNWWARGHRPSHLREFSQRIVEACRTGRPRWMVTTGIAPIDEAALRQIGRMGVTRVDYLTDDPWNRSHYASWFMSALRQYDHIFSTRTSNIKDLRKHGCPMVSYLPFAYAPDLHFEQRPADSNEVRRFSADVAFAGGADPDRVPLIRTLIAHGFRVALYGGYWRRYADTRAHARGQADPPTLRKATAGAKVTLGLVRRANRDGHSMRTFEVAAMAGCMLAEYTEEHREILGEDGEAAMYFRSPGEMVDRLRWLLAHDDERLRLGTAIKAKIVSGRNTYQDRLEAMLAAAGRTP
jgi:spore maturation protein CgeB